MSAFNLFSFDFSFHTLFFGFQPFLHSGISFPLPPVIIQTNETNERLKSSIFIPDCEVLSLFFLTETVFNLESSCFFTNETLLFPVYLKESGNSKHFSRQTLHALNFTSSWCLECVFNLNLAVCCVCVSVIIWSEWTWYQSEKNSWDTIFHTENAHFQFNYHIWGKYGNVVIFTSFYYFFF